MYKHEDSLKILYSIIDYANEPESKVIILINNIIECMCMDSRRIW